MGWGEKAIELRSAKTGSLEGVFMHKKAQKLKFLCERNDKVRKFLYAFIISHLETPNISPNYPRNPIT